MKPLNIAIEEARKVLGEDTK